MMIREPKPSDLPSVVTLAAEVLGPERAASFVRAHVARYHLLVAESDDQVVGILAYRTDWFQCTMISLVCVREDLRRQGVARALFTAVERMSPSPRLFSSTEETNTDSIRMHTALGFAPSGHIDNLPQGYRELLFYKRLIPWGPTPERSVP
jgi:GNAT superfamily N-acetyltransferase